MKVLFTGDRSWTDRNSIRKRLEILPPDTEIIVGDAKGLDTIVIELAWEMGLKVNGPHKANWNEHGKAAGPIRNRAMLDLEPDLVIAYHPDIEKSKGTKDCVNEAKKRNICVEIYNI